MEKRISGHTNIDYMGGSPPPPPPLQVSSSSLHETKDDLNRWKNDVLEHGYFKAAGYWLAATFHGKGLECYSIQTNIHGRESMYQRSGGGHVINVDG